MSKQQQHSMERQLAEWGRQLDAFKQNTEQLGEEAVERLERQYNDLKLAAEGLGERVSETVGEAQERTQASIDKAQSDAGRAREEATSLAQQARAAGVDIGQGFELAWEDLRKSFNQAQERLRR